MVKKKKVYKTVDFCSELMWLLAEENFNHNYMYAYKETYCMIVNPLHAMRQSDRFCVFVSRLLQPKEN
jgi:hypothetical protein